jgi:hypothetical protein
VVSCLPLVYRVNITRYSTADSRPFAELFHVEHPFAAVDEPVHEKQFDPETSRGNNGGNDLQLLSSLPTTGNKKQVETGFITD